MANKDHADAVRSACVTIGAVQERIDDEIDAAILGDAESILSEYVAELETEGGDE